MLKVLLNAPKPGDFSTDMSNGCHYSSMEKKNPNFLFLLLLQKQVEILKRLIGLNAK